MRRLFPGSWFLSGVGLLPRRDACSASGRPASGPSPRNSKSIAMRLVSSTASGNANLGGEAPFIKREGSASVSAAFVAVSRRLWPRKTAQNLAYRTGVSERMAAFWLAGTYEMSLPAAQALMHSEHGFEFLQALMAGSTQAWWWRLEVSHENGVTRRQLKATQRKLDRLRERQEQLDLDV